MDVKVVYTAKNNGKAGKTTFGFPIDRHNLELDQRTPAEKNKDIRNYKVFDGDKEILVLRDSEEAVVIKNMFSEKDMSALWLGEDIENSLERLKLKRKWKIGEIYFDSGEEKTITISYKVKASYMDGSVSSEIIPELSDRYFIYNLSEAKYWGNGKVKKFTMTADFRKNLNKGSKIKSISLSDCTEEDGIYTFKAEDFDLSKNDYIMFVYNNYYHFNKFHEYFEGIDKYYINDLHNSSNIFDILSNRLGYYNLANYDEKIRVMHSSSNNDNSYSVKNLFDGKRSTAWVEGTEGMGEGEFIELEIENFYLSTLGIINGYTKSKETYLNNGRVKKMKVDTALLLENGEIQRFEKIFELEDTQDFKDLKGYEFLSLSELFSCEDINPTTSKKLRMRITILDTYKGLKYEDTCISEILLIGGEEKREDSLAKKNSTTFSSKESMTDEESGKDKSIEEQSNVNKPTEADDDNSIQTVFTEDKVIAEKVSTEKKSSSNKVIISVLMAVTVVLAILLIKGFIRKTR